MKDVKERFGVYTVFGMILSTFRFIFDKDKDDNDKNRIIADIKSFVIINLLNLIAYFITCLLSQVMYYKDKTYTQCIFETLEIIKRM